MEVGISFQGFSSDTQVKTNHGWKNIQDVSVKYDKVLAFDPKSFELHYIKPKEVRTKNVSGYLYRFEHNAADLLVTERQALFLKRSAPSEYWEHLPAEEIRMTYVMPLREFYYSGDDDTGTETFCLPEGDGKENESPRPKDIPMTPWLEFFGFWLTCGYYQIAESEMKYAVGIKRRKDDDAYVLRLFERIGFPAEMYRKDGCTYYETHSQQLWEYLSEFGELGERYVPYEFLELNTHYLETLLLGCEMGNVRIYENFIVYVSQSKKVIEAIQELILKIYGLIARMHYLYIPIKGQPVRHWYIRACTNGDIAHWTAQYQKPKRQKYQELVCGLVLEKNWPMLTRRNDVIIFSGSNEAMHHKIHDCQNERDLTRPPTTPDDS